MEELDVQKEWLYRSDDYRGTQHLLHFPKNSRCAIYAAMTAAGLRFGISYSALSLGSRRFGLPRRSVKGSRYPEGMNERICHYGNGRRRPCSLYRVMPLQKHKQQKNQNKGPLVQASTSLHRSVDAILVQDYRAKPTRFGLS